MIYLKILNKKDVNDKYLKWMNDKKIHKYTEQINKKHSIKKIKNYLEKVRKSKNQTLYGIYDKKKNIHLGNIKLGPINYKKKSSFISYFIGENKYHKKGIGTFAIKLIIDLAKNRRIKRLYAGTYKKNLASIKILKKNKFKLSKEIDKKKIIFEKDI